MITGKMFSNEVLREIAAKCTDAIIASLPAPEECNHNSSERFEDKIQALLHPKLVCIMSTEYISKIEKTVVISVSSPFYYSDICRMLVDIVPRKIYNLLVKVCSAGQNNKQAYDALASAPYVLINSCHYKGG